MNNYCVYKHTSPSGKVYIGITCQNPIKRWECGRGYKDNEHFYRAIQKYGWDNIKHEILFCDLSKEEACSKEIELIKLYNSTDGKCGYNHSTGGDVSSAGIKRSEEFRQKVSKSMKGIKHSAESIEKMRVAKKGHTVTDLARKKMSESHKGLQAGEKHPLFGTHRSEETKRKLSESNSKKVYCIELNTVFKSAKEASEKTGTDRNGITRCCKGKRNKSGGYHWIYF
jgi:group I intron endonuclease